MIAVGIGIALGAGGYTAGVAIDNAVHDRPALEGWDAVDCAMWGALGGVSGGLLGSASAVASLGGKTIAPFLINTAVTEVGYGISAGRKGEWTPEGALLTGGISAGLTGLGIAGSRAWSSLRGGNGAAVQKSGLITYDPPNGGAFGKWGQRVLQVGDEIDRFGFEWGNYASPRGTPFAMRSLSPSISNRPYAAYKVVKQLTVDESIIAPAYGEFGLGTQYRLPQSVESLVEGGFLERIVR